MKKHYVLEYVHITIVGYRKTKDIVHVETYEGFRKALYFFNEKVGLMHMTGRYKNIDLFRFDADGHRIYLRRA